MMLQALFISNFATSLLGLWMAYSRPKRETFIILSIAAIAVQSLIIGLRNTEMMTDTREYASLFLGTAGFEDGIEPFFMAIVRFIRLLSDNANVFLILLSLLINLMYFTFLNNYLGKKSLLVFSFFSSSFCYWLIHVQVIRNGLACVILLIGMYLIMNSKRISGILVAACAVMTHFSTVLIGAAAYIGYAFSSLNFRRSFSALLIFITIYFSYEYIITNNPAFSPWLKKINDYDFYNQTAFGDSSIDYRYTYLVIILLLVPFVWQKQDVSTKQMFLIYIFVFGESFLFWSNILFRDRIMIFSQLIEPFILYKFMTGFFSNNHGDFIVFALSLFSSLLTIFYWGPLTVLIF